MSILRTLATLCGAVALLSEAAPAGAAGGSNLEFEQRYAVVGHTITGSTAFLDDAPGRTAGTIADGPFVAYLLPADRWIDPPRIPARAIRLGVVRIEDIGQPGGMARAHLTFTVPDVTPGRYAIGFCNVPCTKSSVGDLYDGGIHVMATTLDARLAVHRDRLERRMESLEVRLEQRLGQLLRGWERLGEMRNRQDLMGDRVSELEAEIETLRKELGRRPGAGQGWWLVGAASLVAAATVLARRRRAAGARSPGTPLPDGPVVVPGRADLVPEPPDGELSRTT